MTINSGFLQVFSEYMSIHAHFQALLSEIRTSVHGFSQVITHVAVFLYSFLSLFGNIVKSLTHTLEPAVVIVVDYRI